MRGIALFGAAAIAFTIATSTAAITTATAITTAITTMTAGTVEFAVAPFWPNATSRLTSLTIILTISHDA